MKRRWLTAIAALSGLAMLAGYNWGPEALVAAQTVSLSAPTAQVEPQDDAAAIATAAQARPWLGVQVSNVDGGAKVESVVPNSPAAAAVLKPGDVITAVDGQPIGNSKQLVEAIAKRKPGDKVVLAIRRDNAAQDVAATLAEQPKPPAAPRIAPMAPNPVAPLGNLLPEWRELLPAQQLEHFQGGSFSFSDKNGQRVTVEMAAGKVTAVTADSLTIRPNGETVDRSYSIADQARVVPGNRTKLAETMKKDDLVLVVAKRAADKVTALAIYNQTAVQERRRLPGQGAQQPNLRPAPGGNWFFQMPRLPNVRPPAS